MKKLLSLILLFHVMSVSVFSQSTQSGVVKEYNDAKKKTPLGGVEIVVNNAGSNVSAKNGKFVLSFRTLKPGDKVEVRKIEKAGYEIFNKDALDAWRIANDGSEFTIVLCKSAKFKALKDQYNAVASKSYAQQQKKDEQRLASLLKEGKLQQAEYEKKLKELKDKYDEQLENLDNYIDRFARIDLETISKEEQKIIEMVKEGKIEEAIKAYEDMHLEEKFAQAAELIGEANSAIEQLVKVKKKNETAQSEAYFAVKRMNDARMLKGGEDSFEKIGKSYNDLVLADSTYLPAVASYADFLCQQTKFMESIKYYNMYLAVCDDSEAKSIVYQHIGNSYMALGDYPLAKENIESAMKIADSLFSCNINIESNRQRLIHCHLSLGNIYNKLNDAESMEKHYLTCLDAANKYPSVLSDEALFTTYYNLGGFYQIKKKHNLGYKYLTEAINILTKESYNVSEVQKKIELHNVSLQLASACFYVKKDDESEHYFELASSTYKDLLSYNPIAYRNLGIYLYNNMASIKLTQNKNTEAESLLINAIDCINKCNEESPNVVYTIYRCIISASLGVSIAKQLGREGEGLEIINSALNELEPYYKQMSASVGFYYKTMYLQKAEANICSKNYKEVEDALAVVEKIDDKSPELWNVKGLYYFELGNYELAKDCWMKVIMYNPDYSDFELRDKLKEKGIPTELGRKE